jgi:FKBP-type peptidyl-prolyl cis-trans isomerase 2
MKWAIFAFLAFAFFGSSHNRNALNAPPSITQTLHSAADTLNPKKLLPLDTYKSVLLPRTPTPGKTNDGVELLQSIQDIKTGQGTVAVCGQEVKVSYLAYVKNKKATEGHQTSSFRIGEGKGLPVIEQGVVGMKKGGTRTLFATTKNFDVELLDASPAIPDFENTPYRIATIADSNGLPVLCNTEGKFKVTVWNVEGKKLFSSKDDQPVVFTPGKSQVFMGLEQGVIGMKRGEMRTLFVPPAFQKTMRETTSTIDFHLPANQTVLVDVEAIP